MNVNVQRFPWWAKFEKVIFYGFLWIGTGLILWTSMDYFIPGRLHGFLFERLHLAMQSWWKYTLLAHVVGGLLCLVSSLGQYSKWCLRNCPRVHRYFGRIYALAIITLVFPTGVALSFTAKGGTSGMVGFLMLSVMTLGSLLLGMVAIYKKNLRAHQAWITRSFALVTTAITFRTLQILFHYGGVPPVLNYQLSLWLSIVINLVLAEYYLFKTKNKK